MVRCHHAISNQWSVYAGAIQPSGSITATWFCSGTTKRSVQHQPTQPAVNSSRNDFYLKVLCPENKKEFKTVTLRGLSPENIDTPTKLKEAISVQCSGLDPENMEVGYYSHSTKLWINSRLDVADVWNSIGRGEKPTLWCLDTTRQPLKRKRDNSGENDSQGQASKRPCSSQGSSTVEERKVKAKEYEQKLVELHRDKWTLFQYKLWAEMLVCGTHTSVDEPPSASMFNRESKHPSSGLIANSTLNDTVVSGMMTVVTNLCQALAPKPGAGSTCSSPIKRAELRGTYMKQLTEFKQLRDGGILDQEEYEEQRSDIIKLMRQLRSDTNMYVQSYK